MQNKPTYVHIQFLDSAQLQAASLAWFFFAVLSSLESTYTSCYPPIYSKVLLDQWLHTVLWVFLEHMEIYFCRIHFLCIIHPKGNQQLKVLFLFLTEKAWSHGSLQTRELGQTPSHVSMGN